MQEGEGAGAKCRSDLRADDYASGSLLALSSPSLFGEPRLLRVTGVEKCSDAFLNEARPEVYDPEAAATAWKRTIEFLQRVLA